MAHPGPPPKRWYEPVVFQDRRCRTCRFVSGRGSADAKNKKKQKKAYDLNANPLAGVQSKQPDKELYDKAMVAMKKGRYDVARLDLQTMLNTYPESEYRMRAKLSVGDTWFKEGGSAALTQAEAEYEDFITFFPNAPEAAEAKMKVADIYYQQMEKPDRDFTNAQQRREGIPGNDQHVPGFDLGPARQAEAARCAGGSGRARDSRSAATTRAAKTIVAAIARLETVADTYPLYSKSDQVLIGIGDAYAGEAHNIQIAPGCPAPSESACAPCMRTRPPQPTPRSSRAIPWRPTLRMPATASWP